MFSLRSMTPLKLSVEYTIHILLVTMTFMHFIVFGFSYPTRVKISVASTQHFRSGWFWNMFNIKKGRVSRKRFSSHVSCFWEVTIFCGTSALISFRSEYSCLIVSLNYMTLRYLNIVLAITYLFYGLILRAIFCQMHGQRQKMQPNRWVFQ